MIRRSAVAFLSFCLALLAIADVNKYHLCLLVVAVVAFHTRQYTTYSLFFQHMLLDTLSL